MKEIDLVAIIEDEVSHSIGGGSSGGGLTSGHSKQLATERAMELDYYNSQPFGNEREGESQVVSSDVFDAIEGMLPHLLKTFTASDDAVEFEPVGAEDEEAAKQRTDACNHVFYKQNNGFLIAYTWFKTALMQKNGVVKYYWDDKTDISEDEYEGLTEGEYLTLKQDEDVEVLEFSNYDDPSALEQKQQMLQRLDSAPPEMAQQVPVLRQQIEMQPVPQLYDCKIKRTKDVSQIRIEAIPPEEFGISAKHNVVSIQDTPFCYHERKLTESLLRQMGCPEDVLEEAGGDDYSTSKPEVLARNRFIDEIEDVEPRDDTQKEHIVRDGFIRVDYDGDGIAELRHFITVGRQVWINEPASHINFAAITPIIMPFRWIGKSVAEITMDFQFINSVLMRQVLNNLYLTNNPQKVVLGSAGGQVQADLDRLMTSRVGGILVEYTPNAIRNQEVPFAAAATMPIIEYFEGKKEQRTGNTRYNQGTDADSLNKTARGISMIQSAAQQKIDLIARIFAETGFKDLFRGIAYLLSKYSSKKMMLKLRGKWVDIDPREWKNQMDMTVNVGLGTGNKDAQLVHLVKMHEVQLKLMETGRGYLVTDANVYNLSKKMAENMGFKHPEMFISDPASVQKPPPQPPIEMLKLQQADAEVKQKIGSTEKIRQFDAQTTKEVEQMKLQTQMAIAAKQEETKVTIAKLQIDADARIEVFKANNALKDEADALNQERSGLAQEKLELQVDKELHSIQKQVATESLQNKDKAISDKAAAETKQTKDVSTSIEPIASAVKELAPEVKKIAKQQEQLASIVVSLKDEQDKASKEKKKPRVYDVKKSDSGYQITSK